MATLEYLDGEGSVKNFTLVPWKDLNSWLSLLNGRTNSDQDSHSARSSAGRLPNGINRGKVIEELEARRNGQDSAVLGGALRLLNRDRGYGQDWREYENPDGYTHLEELLIHQPDAWRKQAREYLFRFKFNLDRSSTNSEARTVAWTDPTEKIHLDLFLKSPILAVLFHPGLKRTMRYEPLNFLLAYGVGDPLPLLTRDMTEAQQIALRDDLSPLTYLMEFQTYALTYQLDTLRKMGKESSFPRLCLIKELDFSDIIGQRLAKQIIRQSFVSHIWNRSGCGQKASTILKFDHHPLSMIFAGPSGNGKTELAKWLAKLMNKPGDDLFIKVDCGKLTDSSEVFGKAGAYQGAEQGSALNNFVLSMSLKPEAVGIVLLDEIEKAGQSVIHALYQVIDKGEWTNKKLGGRAQTETIPCHNLVFVMTTNACDMLIDEFTSTHRDIYTAVGEEFNDMGRDLEQNLKGLLQHTYPFTEAFIGRIGRVVPFLPMANGTEDSEVQHPLHGEMMTVAKLLIEREQERYTLDSTVQVHQRVTSKTKHRMAKIIVKEAIPAAGVRSIQKAVQTHMSNKMLDAILVERGGIQPGAHVQYYAKEEDRKIDFRNVEHGTESQDPVGDDENDEQDEDLYS